MSAIRSEVGDVLGRSMDFLPYIMLGAIALGLFFEVTEGPLALLMLIVPAVLAVIVGTLDVVL